MKIKITQLSIFVSTVPRYFKDNQIPKEVLDVFPKTNWESLPLAKSILNA